MYNKEKHKENISCQTTTILTSFFEGQIRKEKKISSRIVIYQQIRAKSITNVLILKLISLGRLKNMINHYANKI
jgi:hypothetical protein